MAINPRKIKKKSIADLMPVVKQGDILSQRAAKVNRPTSSGKYSGYGNRTSSASYGYTPTGSKKPIMPSVSMAGGGVNRPEVKKTGVNQIAMDQSNAAAKAKKKAGATTSAAPAKPKKSWFQRRQAERYAIGSSGKSL